MNEFSNHIPHPAFSNKDEYSTGDCLNSKMLDDFRKFIPEICATQIKKILFKVQEVDSVPHSGPFLTNPHLNFEISIKNTICVTIDPRILNFEWAIKRCSIFLSAIQILCSDYEVEYCRLNVCDTGDPSALSCSLPEKFACRLIPDFDYISSLGYKDFLDNIAKNKLEFKEKIDKLFWRGSLIFNNRSHPLGPSLEDLVNASQRLRLCNIALGESFFDAKCTAIWVPDRRILPELLLETYMGSHVDRFEFAKYKFQIDIDGFSSSWSGLFQKLSSGSCVLKVASPHQFVQWYYKDLKPWVHYVPIGENLSDLKIILELLRRNDRLPNEIGQSGSDFAGSLTFLSQMAVFRDKIINFPKI